MIGGIYCEAPLGSYYESKTLGSVNSRMKSIFGSQLPSILQDKSLTQAIIDYWYGEISSKMSKILSSWKVPGNRGYYNRTVDLTRSICLGVYYNGKLRKMYRFTGGRSERSAFSPSDMGNNNSSMTTARLASLSMQRHPDPAERAREFLDSYELAHKSGYTLVIAATMPYAVRLEVEYGLPVLRYVINRMLRSVYDFKQGVGNVMYGYIFASGEFGGGSYNKR